MRRFGDRFAQPDAFCMIELGVGGGDSIELVSSAGEAADQHQAVATPSCIPAGMHPRVSNIVAVVQVSCSLSLRQLSDRISNSEYNPRRFGALIVRIKEPKTTAMVYPNGKMIITGARSMEHLHQASRLYVRAIKKAGYPDCTVLSMPRVANMVASCNLLSPLRLEALHLALGGSDGGSQYDTEVFPAIIYRLCEPEVTFMIFSSGNINIMGAKSYPDIVAALEKMLAVILLYRRD